MNEYLNEEYYASLTSLAQQQIDNHYFNVGTITASSSDNMQTDMLSEEKYKWLGQIGLLNVTDYVKASTNSNCTRANDYSSNSSCYNNTQNYNWLFDSSSNSPRFINGRGGSRTNVWGINTTTGAIGAGTTAISSYGVRPVLYLKSYVKIISGEGTSDNPFQLGNGISTSLLDKPTFSEVEIDNGKTVTITYPEGEDLIYEYQKDGGSWQIATQNQQVSFTESGTLVARVSDGTNEASASYSIEVGVNMGGINLPVVEIGDGLYKDAYEEDLYIYRGGNPNNYVRFSNNLWQIISINTETNTIKIMAPSSIYFLEPYDTESGRYLRTGYCSSNEYGCNIWGSKSTLYNVNMQPITSLPRSVDDSYSYGLPTEEAYLNTYLNTTYYNTYISAESKSMLTEGIFKVGMVKSDSSQTLKTDIEQASSVKWKGKVGVIDVTEYVRASTNPLCTGLYAYDSNSSCYSELDSNYMTTPNDAYDFWTLTPAERSGDTGYVYRIMGDSGDVHLNVADYESYRPRPVVTLSSSVKITGGDGSSGNPYQLSL